MRRRLLLLVATTGVAGKSHRDATHDPCTCARSDPCITKRAQDELSRTAGRDFSDCFDPPERPLARPRWRSAAGNFSGQGLEDRCLFNMFFSCGERPPFRRHGTFVEIGALNGRTFSNTAFFQEAMGWDGVLIESNSALYAKLRRSSGRCSSARRVRGSRRRGEASCVHAAVCNSTLPVELVEAHAIGGLVNYSGKGTNCMQRRKRNHPRTVMVRCERLDAILQHEGVAKVDFLSLDMEGAEDSVLQTLGSIQVGVLLVEMNQNKDQAAQVCRRLRSRGMVQVATGVGHAASNSIWAVPSEAEHLQTSCALPRAMMRHSDR